MQVRMNTVQRCDTYEMIWRVSPLSVDLVVTDPPYGQIDQAWDREADWKFLAVAFNRVLKRTGQIYVFCKLPFAADIIREFGAYFRFRFDYVWSKPSGMFRNKTSPVPTHELILCFSRHRVPVGDLTFHIDRILTEGKPYKASHSDRKFDGIKHGKFGPMDTPGKPTNLRYPLSVIYERNMSGLREERLGHPTQKPESIVHNLIVSSSNPGDLVCDPFMGTWTTAVVAKTLQRNFLGFEIEEKYCRIGRKRLFESMN